MPSSSHLALHASLSVSEAHLELAKHCLLFRSVDMETLQRIPDFCDVVKLAPGDILISLGQQNDKLYLVLDGEIRIQTGVAEHHHYVTLQAGECVGEMSLIDGNPASAIVSAVTDSQLLRIQQDALWSLIENSHSIARNLLHILSGRLRSNNVAMNEALEQRAYFEKAAYLDSLTGVHNRRWLNKAFPRELERCQTNNEPLSFAFVDIDHFKNFNDSYGHLAGDIALRAIAQALTKALRPTDLLARFGGEEFAIVFPRADATVAITVAERLRTAVSQLSLRSYDGSSLPTISLSAGLATMSDSDDVESLIARADKALYEAKNSGRDQVVASEV
ncbi:MAG: GGDEF domain-containing protein [Gammaproteobacteria bacterium]|nr:GGDEF domain-containing protein [Gammaproteobacteria bacterium]